MVTESLSWSQHFRSAETHPCTFGCRLLRCDFHASLFLLRVKVQPILQYRSVYCSFTRRSPCFTYKTRSCHPRTPVSRAWMHKCGDGMTPWKEEVDSCPEQRSRMPKSGGRVNSSLECLLIRLIPAAYGLVLGIYIPYAHFKVGLRNLWHSNEHTII